MRGGWRQIATQHVVLMDAEQRPLELDDLRLELNLGYYYNTSIIGYERDRNAIQSPRANPSPSLW